MKDIRFLPLLLLSIGFCASCSRSLTDYGYSEGIRTTVRATDIGPVSLSEPHISKSQGTTPASTSIDRSQPIRTYSVSDRYIFLIDNLTAADKTTRKGLFFLEKFYTDLNNEFKSQKFSKKYSASVNASIKDRICTSIQPDSVDNHRGWQIFNEQTSSYSGNRYIISYVRNSWYAITSQIAPTSAVLVQLRTKPQGKGFLITGLKNESREIDIE